VQIWFLQHEIFAACAPLARWRATILAWQLLLLLLYK
jgi:hypothetical protein